jgi:hypothetical protein
MAFPTGYLSDLPRVGSGEIFDPNYSFNLSATTFEDGLIAGRFAKMDTGRLDNFDGSATPVVAGVVIRDPATPIDDAGAIDATLFDHADYMRKGAITVDVKDGETPSMFGAVYVSNAGDADDGKATATNTDVASGGWEFIKEIKPGVWLIAK